ncbi:GNAT family N-acetyltransferase [Xanthobacter dioxanivorans]|uniref:GNAT family N-acetyltransferase n=1 Tax=Xanthobacter dioxanivorans TaxID=2528964 RepID=UPI001E39D6E7|nr:GNAT family N-acetyltransferase [Xanthobacter dioxanivorans]
MPVTVDAPVIRAARPEDLQALVALFAADELGGHGDTCKASARADYRVAFDAIDADPRTCLFVAELDGRVVGTFQLVVVHSLPARGALRALLEAVQVDAGLRGRRIGEAMVRFAIGEARRAGAKSLALTSNKVRLDAHRFYRRLGFANSHEGFKIGL